MLKKFFKYIVPYLKTLFLYKLFFKKSGRNVIIINPIQFTAKYVTIGNNVLISHHARVEGVSSYEGVQYSPSIIIGNNVKIQQNLHLTCAGRIFIGDNTAVAANVTISDIIHGYENINIPPEKHTLTISEVIIGDDCKIFNNVVILPGAKLGKHNVVGANSVVVGEFDDYCVIGGTPAKVLKKYNKDTKTWEKTT